LHARRADAAAARPSGHPGPDVVHGRGRL